MPCIKRHIHNMPNMRPYQAYDMGIAVPGCFCHFLSQENWEKIETFLSYSQENFKKNIFRGDILTYGRRKRKCCLNIFFWNKNLRKLIVILYSPILFKLRIFEMTETIPSHPVLYSMVKKNNDNNSNKNSCNYIYF